MNTPTDLLRKYTDIVNEGILPKPQIMAEIILKQFDKAIPQSVKASPEPYRAMMYYLGYEKLDGTPWWDQVMDAIG
jgi:hypothetical protein